SGIGGGAFMVHYDRGAGELRVYDSRETAPAAARPDRFLREGKPLSYAESVNNGQRYMIATANPLASEAGYRILRAGGSATDAIIAAQLVLNLVEPQSSGIGGGAFMVHYDRGAGELRVYDSRETAPAAA
ncbi:hypothetical protein CKW47_20360, partial [Bordetella pertussis]